MHFNAMSKSVTIRDLPEDTHRELAARAARGGQSLQEYLRGELIELARKPDVASLMARVSERKRRTGQRLSRDVIVAHRDADRP